MAEFRMPALGADMDEGTIAEWLVKPGDAIRKGEPIAVVDTAKSAIEVESFHTGTVAKLLIGVGETVPVGTVLATIAELAGPGLPAETPIDTERAGATPAAAGKAEAAAAGAPAAEGAAAAAGAEGKPRRGAGRRRPPSGPGRAAAKKPARARKPAGAAGAAGAEAARAEAAPAPGAPPGAGQPAAPLAPAVAAHATPLVRREAGELGVDLARVHGTGRGGAITRADVEQAAATRRLRVSPLARRVAAELGVELAGVSGTGPGGAIRESDIRAAARAGGRPRAGGPQALAGTATPAGTRPAPAGAAAAEAAHEAAAAERAGRGPAGKAERALAMRQAIARLMARSKREIPHYYVSNTVDLGVAMAWLRERNRELEMSERLVPAALLLKAAALAARQVPQVNGYWVDDHFDQAAHVHLGTAISLRGGGLITPAIHDADQLPLTGLMAALRDLVTRARAGRLRRAELTDATLTVTNLGDQGVESVQGVIYPPQVALVGFGKVVERPWAVGGLLGVRPVVFTTLAADHRATDGYTGGRYLAAIAELLQRPEEL
ncbi:MAG: 2-oxo acid dehydrogenase subunit E2 [Gemmatimonadota bacterium]